LFSLPVGTEMFHFPTLPLSALCVQTEMMGHDSHRVPPFGNPRIKALLAAPRGFSQPHTTFFGFWCLGIRHLHLIIFLLYYFLLQDARVHCVVLKIRADIGTLLAYLETLNLENSNSSNCSLWPEGSYPQDPTTCIRDFATIFFPLRFPSGNPERFACTNDLFLMTLKNQCSTVL
jgi:hypothetical protein